MNASLLAPAAAAMLAVGALGASLLALARHPSRGLERLALACGLGLSAWPLLWWATTPLGPIWRPWSTRASVALMLAGAWIAWRPQKGDGSSARGICRVSASHSALDTDPAGAWRTATVSLLAVALLSRWRQAGTLVAPAWVDGYHHSVITALLAGAGRVPADFAPYLEGVPFYYHFGFHALAATAAHLSGAAPHVAVLATGQALSALAALTTWALARRLTGSEAAATVAAAVPVAWHFFPAYYVSWARYTQLAGLVALPVAWLLLHEASHRGRAGVVAATPSVGLAAVAAAGLAHVHYRVLVFFALGAAVLAIWTVSRRAWPSLARLAAVSGFAGLVAAPWLLGPFRRGSASLAGYGAAASGSGAEPGAAERGWWAWSSAVDDLPRWLFTIEFNDPLLVAAGLALVLALLAGHRGADALGAWLIAALLLVHPTWLGLSSSWLLPRFALAITAWLPIALALGLGIAVVQQEMAMPAPRGRLRRRGPRLAAVLFVAVTAGAAWRQRDVANPETVILTRADLHAAEWMSEHVPIEETVLVSSGHWHLGSYRGLDGGYWLPLLTGHRTTMPLSFYAYGSPPRVRAIQATAELASRGDALDDATLDRLMDTTGARWIYVGPSSQGEAGRLSPERLARHPRLVERFAQDGVTLFERVGEGISAIPLSGASGR